MVIGSVVAEIFGLAAANPPISNADIKIDFLNDF